MDDPCFNCDDQALRIATLEIPSGKQLEEKPICSTCIAFFERARFIQVDDVFLPNESIDDDRG